VGSNYLAVCEQATGHDADYARRAALGLKDVLAGRCAQFSMEYPCHSPTEERWFVMHATPLESAELQGAVVSHINISAWHTRPLPASSPNT
jgi:hypothetical protein